MKEDDEIQRISKMHKLVFKEYKYIMENILYMIWIKTIYRKLASFADINLINRIKYYKS